MSFIPEFLRTVGVILAALMILNIMIVVHEWGHFLAARWRGLKVEKFQIWFGKPLWKKTINGVQYGLGSIPAGGFVQLPQMAPMGAIEGTSGEKAETLPPISPLDKIIVAFAGPLFSFLLAVVCAVLVWKVGRPINEPENPTQIGYIRPGHPAAHSDLRVGDVIRKIDGKPVDRWVGQVSSVIWGIVSSEHEQIRFTVERGNQTVDVLVTPTHEDLEQKEVKPASMLKRAYEFVFDRPPLRKVGIDQTRSLRVAEILPNSPGLEAGLQIGDVVTAVDGRPVGHPWEISDRIRTTGTAPITLSVSRAGTSLDLVVTPRPPDKPGDIKDPSTGLGFGEERKPTSLLNPSPGQQITESLKAMKNLITAIASKSDISVTHMGGPLTIVRTYTHILSNPEAFRWVLWFSVILNINLAVMNMLPFPVLDGGHITMAIIEWIRRRPINVRLLEYVQSACVLLLLGFFIIVTLKDVGDYGGGGEVEFLPRRDAQAPSPAK